MHANSYRLTRGPGHALALGLYLLATACPPAARLGQPCAQNSECLDSELCVDNACRQVCNSSDVCRRNEGCRNGVCLPLAPDASVADRAMVDALVFDRGRVDGVAGDGHRADGQLPDQARSDLAASERWQPDILSADSGPVDAAATDLAGIDAAVLDRGPAEAAWPDRFAAEASSVDGNTIDAATVDVSAGDAAGCHRDQDCAGLDATCVVGKCNIGTGQCTTETTPDADCDDGIACTVGDICDAQGQCAGTPDHGRCMLAGQECRPGCFPGPTGCGTPPQDMLMTCAAQASGQATCTLQPGGLSSDQSACLSCSARAGFTLVNSADFEDDSDMCSLDGWELVEGNVCTDRVDNCVLTSTSKECCAELGTLCDATPDGFRLRSDRALNCGIAGRREWRLRRTFDLTGLQDLRFCLDVGEAYATASDAVVVQVSEGLSAPSQISCTPGDVHWRGGVQTVCADLPSWASGHPAVTVTVIAHSHNDGDEMRVDNLYLYGWRTDCPASAPVELLREPFDGCPDPIPDGWRDWSVSGSPRCSTAGCTGSGSSAWAEGAASWTISHHVDTRGISGDLELCLQAGDVAGYMGERVTVLADLGDGTGWQRVGWGSMYNAADRQCEPVCFNLSAFSPGVAHNPDLRVALTVEASAPGLWSMIDDVLLSGVASCDASGLVDVSAVRVLTPGRYQVDVNLVATAPALVELTCAWGDPATGAMAYQPIQLP